MNSFKQHFRYRSCLLLLFVLAGFALLLNACSGRMPSCDIRDAAEYGKIPNGWNTNQKMSEAFETFFPQALQPYYRDVQYRYHAVNMVDEWTAEMYLEFTVEDQAQFEACVQTVAPPEEFTRFSPEN